MKEDGAVLLPAEMCKLNLNLLFYVVATHFKVIYERKVPEKKQKQEFTALSFKTLPKIDLSTVASKVKPGMLLCDDSVMSIALRQRVKFEYRDFQK